MQASLSHYRILERIGAGGMGVVYRAHDEHLDLDVALKVLPEGELADEATHKRFRREARALSKLNHPNIAIIHDFDSQDGTDFLVQELIPGLSMTEMLAHGPLPEREIIDLGIQLAEGLAAAHEQQVIHRDLKPDNIRVTPDARLKILDFGLARITQPLSPTALTTSDTHTAFAGTIPYMAPEQLLGERLDTRVDIWAAGCVLYEMSTGRRPFSGEGPALVDEILHHRPPTPLKLNTHLSEGMAAIILQCLEKDASLRYASAREIAVDLRRLISNSSSSPVTSGPHRLRPIHIAAALVLLLIFGVVGVQLYIHWHKRPMAPSVDPSIAVLPFVDMSPEKDQEYFADGLTEELLNSMARTPGLRVVARTSSFQFKGQSPNLVDVGRRLNVATILEGSIRKQAKRVRITAQLINVSDGFHLWSQTYDRELNDIFKVQEDIAQSVAASLKVTLLGGTNSSRGTTEDAYNNYLQGRYFYGRGSRENMVRAIDYFERATKLDPNYAPAWAGLADAQTRQSDWGYVPADQGYKMARSSASRAIALDPNLPEAIAAMGWVKTYEGDWTGADAYYKRALDLAPGNANIINGASAIAFALGRLDEAIVLDRRGVAQDSLNTQAYVTLAFSAYFSGLNDEAETALKKALEIDPARQFVHTLLAQVYIARSRPDLALQELEKEPDANWRLYGQALAYHALGRKHDSDAALADLVAKYQRVNAYQIADVYAFRGETDQAFDWLHRAYHLHDSGMAQAKCDPLLKSLTHDPRFLSLLKEMNLPTN